MYAVFVRLTITRCFLLPFVTDSAELLVFISFAINKNTCKLCLFTGQLLIENKCVFDINSLTVVYLPNALCRIQHSEGGEDMNQLRINKAKYNVLLKIKKKSKQIYMLLQEILINLLATVLAELILHIILSK